ncbi:MAG TPA: polysaccharide deacetylase family protein, partial [Candidatus Glassbacteria bacterium]|nr:polysaccharide deacetylase family protein [Candidatus Glassbacteria bacterium]
MSWKEKILLSAGRGHGKISTALVYAAGGRFYSRWQFEAQGRLAAQSPFAGNRLTLSFDVDYPVDAAALPEVCDLLALHGITASFAVIGRQVEDFPAEHRRLVEAGHELLNHTYSHPDNELLHPDESFDELTHQAKRAQIENCRKVCEDRLGTSPAGFRAPHFGNVTGRDFYGILAETGCRFSSSVTAPSSGSFGLPYRTAEGIVEFPVSCCPVHPFAVLDTWH